MNYVNWAAWILVVVGALNWGLFGVANYNVVSTIFGTGTLTSVVYDLVGLSGVWLIVQKFVKM